MHTMEQLRSGALAGSRHLKLCCGLKTFPDEIFDLSDTLEVLDLSGNALSELPAGFGRLRKLRIVFCSNNEFTALPAVLGDCPALSMIGFKANAIVDVSPRAMTTGLRWLILTDNRIRDLPDAIGGCSELQKLMLAGNQLVSLPDTLGNCRRLELIRLSANRMEALPAFLLTLPRLSWLAYAGNPFTADLEAQTIASTAVRTIPWSDLHLQDVLGQGASGIIHRAELVGDNGSPGAMAVKLFKGDITSDGSPESEFAASIAAGAHPNLIAVAGRIAGHPAGTHGLVMPLVTPDFRNLAGPPSFESCTRDIYPPDTIFSVATVLRLAAGLASAAQHLHERGIMHGDFYAHNTLHAGEGRALLGDFGAASLYWADGGATAARLEQIEVRAFGCLLEELCDRCPEIERQPGVATVLRDLTSAALSDHAAERPTFSTIAARLAGVTER